MIDVNKKVLIIGGSGFFGSHLADLMSETGFEVSIFDEKPSQWKRPEQEMILGDIMSYEDVLSAVQGKNYVYHLAGVADIEYAAHNPRNAIETNIIGSTNIIEACIKAKVERFLFASTIYVYSNSGSFYRVSKQAVESILDAYHHDSGLEYTVLRYGSLYGPRAQKWNGMKRFVQQAVENGRIVYPGTGEERREYIYVRDAAKLSIQALEPEFANQCLTLTGTQVMSTNEVMRMIQEILGREVTIEFSETELNYKMFHYSLTPYRYTPRRGGKIVPQSFVDLGKGILELIEEIDSNQPQD